MITFGEDEGAHWRGAGRKLAGGWSERFDGLTLPIDLRVPGKHNVMNAVAALAALDQLDFDPEAVVRGVRIILTESGDGSIWPARPLV